MRKILFALTLGMSSLGYAGVGDINLISKIAPYNDGFQGMVDSSQTIVNTTNFSNNLSGSDTDVQKALETIDQLSISGGGGGASVNVSPHSVLFSTGGTTISGDTGFQYDDSVSSITANGAVGIHGVLDVDRPDLGTGFVSRSQLYFDPNTTSPTLNLYSYYPIAPQPGIHAYNSSGYDVGSIIWGIGNGSTFSVYSASCTTCSSAALFQVSGNTQRTQFRDFNGNVQVEFDMVGNSSFTIPVYLASTLTLPTLTSKNCLGTNSSGVVIEGSCTGGGASSTTASVAYGSIYTSSGNVTQTGVGLSPVKLVAYQINGDASGTTPDYTNSQITVSTTAPYSVFASVYSTGTGVFTQRFWIAVNDTPTSISCPDTPSARCVMSGVLALSATDVVSVYTSANVVGSTITVQDAQLSVHSVGGSGGSSGGSSSGGVSVYPATSTIIVPGIQFSAPTYPLALQELSASAGLCTMSNGCVPPTQYRTSTSSFNYVASVFQAGTTQYWQSSFVLPGNYVAGSTFTFKVGFTSTATITTNWKVDAVCVNNGGSSDVAWGTAVTVSTGSVASTSNTSQESGPLVPAGSCAPYSSLHLRLYRNGDPNGDAYFRRLLLYFQKNKYSAQ